MLNLNELLAQDLKHIWHPCTQMKDFAQHPPLVVTHAQGSTLYTNKGAIIDATASWWCKSLGHGHPAILAAIQEQLGCFEHVIGSETTHPKLVALGEKLAELTQLQHVFFASDGASAVEIAMKIALQANQLKGSSRNEFIALKNSYHGETLAALSVSDLGFFKQPFIGYGVQCHFIQSIPYVLTQQEPLWADAKDYWLQIKPRLDQIKHKVCAIIVEPLLQGATGMRCYSADFLRKLAFWAKENDIYLIADEIMTGLCRTGAWLACHHAEVKPDLICLSKGLTAGTLPLSCVLVDKAIYDLFYDDYETGKTFVHSHTFSGHALAISAALATIHTLEIENMNRQAQYLGQFMFEQMQNIAALTGKLQQVRSLGAVVAADLVPIANKRVGYSVFKEALNRGALMRPLGNTLYWFPPLNIEKKMVENLAEITLNSIKSVY